MVRRRIPHAMAYVTAPDRETARTIARVVVEGRLAACANYWPVESRYWWQGTQEEASEYVIIFKTRRSLVRKLIAAVRGVHPAQVPCIVSYPMGDAWPEYLSWIDAETAQR